MGRPELFTVQTVPYKVQYEELTKENLHGQCNSKGLIRINHIDLPVRQAKCLIHELLHAGLLENGIYSSPHETNEQEQVVRNFEPVVFDLLRNNDFSFLRGELPFTQVEPTPQAKPRHSFWEMVLRVYLSLMSGVGIVATIAILAILAKHCFRT